MRHTCCARHGLRVLGFTLVLAIALLATPPAFAGVLPTGLPDNGLSAAGGGVMFDLTSAVNPLTVTSFDYYASAAAGTATSVDVYFKSGTHVGFESNSGAWTFAGNAAGVSNGSTTLAPLNTPDIGIPAGQTVAVYLIAQAGGIRYDGVAPIQQTYSNADITLFGGIARSAPWGGTNFSPRVFAGNVYYDIVPEPASLGAVSIACTLLLRRENALVALFRGDTLSLLCASSRGDGGACRARPSLGDSSQPPAYLKDFTLACDNSRMRRVSCDMVANVPPLLVEGKGLAATRVLFFWPNLNVHKEGFARSRLDAVNEVPP